MRKYKLGMALIVIMAMAIGLSGCTTFDNFKSAFIDKPEDKQAVVTIGVYEPESGADAQAAKDELKGIKLAHKVYGNTSNMIVNLDYVDNKSDISAAETAIKTLVARKPTVILGSSGSVYSLAAGETIREAKIPTIAMTNTNPLVTKNNEYYYRVCYVDANQGDAIAKYVLNEKNEKKAAVIVPEGDDASVAIATAFSDRMKAETDDEDAISVYETFKPGTDDYGDIFAAIKKAEIKEVFLHGDEVDTTNIINQADRAGLEVEFLGDADFSTKEFKSKLNDLSTVELSFVQLFNVNEGNVVNKDVEAERQTFLDAYAAEYGNETEPSNNVALGYNAYKVAIDAIALASDGTDSEAVQEVLSSNKYEFVGATGTIRFSTTGDPITPVYISKWSGDTIETICTVNPK